MAVRRPRSPTSASPWRTCPEGRSAARSRPCSRRHQLSGDRAPGLRIERPGGPQVLRALEPQDRAAGPAAEDAVDRTGLVAELLEGGLGGLDPAAHRVCRARV